MLNFINIGFEHALKFSIDDHEMWIVGTDAGFVEPQLADVSGDVDMMTLVAMN